MTIERFGEILAEFSRRAINVTTDTTFQSLGYDSLDVVELLMKIEDETGVTVPSDNSLKTIGDIVDYINANKK